MQRPIKRTRDADSWRTCSEGFSDFFSNNVATSNKSDKNRRNSAEYPKQKAAFTPGNIFEKLAFPSEETSQGIAWSSSENDDKVDVVEPRKKRNKRTPQPVARKTRSSVRHQPVEIVVSLSDTEERVETSQESNTATTTSTKSEAVSIKGYESDQDIKEECDRERTPSPSQELDCPSSISISTPLSLDSQSGIGVKASEWVKSLQLKTPNKTDQTSKLCDIDDSAKKKKKHSRCGLAEQLTKLQNRDKSSVRVWKHQHTAVPSSQDARSICLEVTGFELLYSLQLLKCKNALPTSDTQKDPSNYDDCNDRLVMIPANQAEELKLQPGMMIKIYPPWQQLELSTGQQIMLCTKYCHVIEHSGLVDDTVVKPPEHMENVTVSAKWNCPCAQGLCTSQSLCPAYQFPCIPGYIQNLVTTSDIKAQETDSNSNNLKAATRPPQQSPSSPAATITQVSSRTATTHLHTVGLRSFGSRTKSHSSLTSGSIVLDSILESIESDRSKGDNHINSLCFKGHVHKKIQICDKGNETSYHLFVEDVVGTVCLVKLSTSSFHELDIDEEGLEGKTFQFSGLQVHDRITRDRDPGLLSMVDRVWSGTHKNKLASQDEEAPIVDAPAEFCYILVESFDTTFDMLPCLVDLYSEKEVLCQTMSEIMKPREKCVRCDCLVRIVYLHYNEKKKQEIKSIYVVDRTRTIPTCVKLDKDHSDLTIGTAADAFKLIKDLCVFNGEAVIDSYTGLINDPSTEGVGKYGQIYASLQDVNIHPNPIAQESCINDIIHVTGVICEVDEDSAYSWEVCKSCGSDQIQMDLTTGISKCNDCKKTNLDTGVRMKMEVIVKVNNSSMKVKIDLLQSTIESLLPKDEEDEDGYELSSVLSKHLGPLNCLITATGQPWTFNLKQIEIWS